MSEQIQEYCDSRGVRMRVDRESGVIRGVKILGLKSRNGRSYLPEALRQAAALYENAKVNVNHPKGHPASPRDYQDRLGQIRGVEMRPEEGLFGDLHFNPKHALAEQLVWDAEHAPENVGFSHNVEARTARRGEEVVVEAITRVQSVDLVADPATTRGLFESVNVNASRDVPVPGKLETPQNLDDLKSLEPDLLERIDRQSKVIERMEVEIARLSNELLEYKIQPLLTRLLCEHHLPALGSNAPRDHAILSETFLETLLDAESEDALRRLIADRANLVAMLTAETSGVKHCLGEDQKPVSRDQNLTCGTHPLNAKTFVEAIT